MRIFFKIIVFAFCFTSFLSEAQLKYDNFNANVVNKKVLLSWTVKAGDQCQGIFIQWSEDSLTFTDIGDIQGTCGDPFNDSDYDFLHTSPLVNTKNYYRLRFGTAPYSEVISVEVIDVNVNEYILRPNPVRTLSELIISNPGNEEIVLEVKDALGKTVFNQKSNTDRFFINALDLPSGNYYFVISSPRIAIRGKFICL